ncbi:MAG: MogA/MoaB family molybdenum cofactor biosynthesis protein, partial [Ruminococcus sp.]|nr:MogA/MoaB family molybdenum cofactor biosynthesis protein [Ruminococcus sp.]
MYKASVITISDRASSGEYEDKSGALICTMLKDAGYELSGYIIIPDEKNKIKNTLVEECDKGVELIITTGGTGFAPRDV